MKNKNNGASLTELLIASALGLWLIGGVLLCYLSNQRTYRLTQALAHMQENGRIAIYLLSEAIRTAGYAGCLPLSSLALNPLNGMNIRFLPETRIAAWHKAISSSPVHLPDDIIRNAVLNSDILLVQNMVPENITVISTTPESIKLSEKSNDKAGDILLIADCAHADLVQVNTVKNNLLTIRPGLTQSYDSTSQIGRLTSVFYYIRKTNRKNVTGMPIYGLYQRDINQPATLAQEVAEGVENMQIKFGIKEGKKINYLPVQNLAASDWRSIVSVQINLLLNSIEPVATQGDRLLRQEWNATTAIREPE